MLPHDLRLYILGVHQSVGDINVVRKIDNTVEDSLFDLQCCGETLIMIVGTWTLRLLYS